MPPAAMKIIRAEILWSIGTSAALRQVINNISKYKRLYLYVGAKV